MCLSRELVLRRPSAADAADAKNASFHSWIGSLLEKGHGEIFVGFLKSAYGIFRERLCSEEG